MFTNIEFYILEVLMCVYVCIKMPYIILHIHYFKHVYADVLLTQTLSW